MKSEKCDFRPSGRYISPKKLWYVACERMIALCLDGHLPNLFCKHICAPIRLLLCLLGNTELWTLDENMSHMTYIGGCVSVYFLLYHNDLIFLCFVM